MKLAAGSFRQGRQIIVVAIPYRRFGQLITKRYSLFLNFLNSTITINYLGTRNFLQMTLFCGLIFLGVLVYIDITGEISCQLYSGLKN